MTWEGEQAAGGMELLRNRICFHANAPSYKMWDKKHRQYDSEALLSLNRKYWGISGFLTLHYLAEVFVIAVMNKTFVLSPTGRYT